MGVLQTFLINESRAEKSTYRKSLEKDQALYNALHCVAGQAESAAQVPPLPPENSGKRSLHQRSAVTVQLCGRQQCIRRRTQPFLAHQSI